VELTNFKFLSFLILAPYIVGSSPADSSFDEYSFGVGGGQYTYHDCSGVHSNSFVDAGAKFTHKYDTPLRIGISATVGKDNIGWLVMPFPDIAYDVDYFSIGTTGIRLGLADGPYAELSLCDQIPLFSGRGCFRTGICVKPSDNTHLWLGMNIVPYDKNGFAGQFDFPISSHQFLFLNGRYGKAGGLPEYGFSIGTRIKVH
jgi:hypothetical protein